MARHIADRGSALLMVVGLLTIIAMLGTTFLLVTRLDSRQSASIGAKSQAVPVAEGALAEALEPIGLDLNRRADQSGDVLGPYSAWPTDGSPPRWTTWIDYPYQPDKTNTTDPKNCDIWLSSGKRATPHYSYVVKPLDWSMVDTDSNAGNDAYLFPTKAVSPDGSSYFAAVRLTDLSSRICVNTAAFPKAANLPGPINVDLRAFMPDWNDTSSDQFSEVHKQRCGGAATAYEEYNASAARRLIAPAGQLKPFAISDEMYLRFLKSGAKSETGRLYDALCPAPARTPFPASKREFLTTYSVSRTRVRHPRSGASWPFDEFLSCVRLDLDLGLSDTSGQQNRMTIYKQMAAFMADLGISGDSTIIKKMAAHFVANLWAYQIASNVRYDPGSPHSIFNRTYGFKPDGEAFTAFGLVQEPIISEAFAKHEKQSYTGETPNDDWFCAYAIKIMNPADSNINLARYKLVGPSTTVALSQTVNKNFNTSVVLWSFKKGNGCTLDKNTAAGFLAYPRPDWIEVPSLDFSGEQKWTIVRDVAGTQIPIDTVSGEDLDYKCEKDQQVNSANETCDIRRDDSQTRARYNVAAYHRTKGSEANNHRLLSTSNNLKPGDALTHAVGYAVPIFGMPAGQTALKDFAEITRLYMVGPRVDGTAKIPLSEVLKDNAISSIFPEPSLGRMNLCGKYANQKYNVPEKGWSKQATWKWGLYPSIPAACLLNEFFTLVPPDENCVDDLTRLYGRININTAEKEVLRSLPWPDSIGSPGGTATYSLVEKDAAGKDQLDRIIDMILAYRDDPESRKYNNCGIDGLRGWTKNSGNVSDDTNVGGFLSPGEIAVVLARYTEKRWSEKSVPPDVNTHKDYLDCRDYIYRCISNHVTVKSDSYAANVLVQLGRDSVRFVWRYVAVIDRSNCHRRMDRPTVVLFSEAN